MVSKPSGLVVHRSELAGDRDNCMTRLRAQLGRRVFSVHRLDRGASGALLFGLDPAAARALTDALADRVAEKRYLVVVRGWPPESGTIDRPLVDQGRELPAHTSFRRLATSELAVATGPRHATSRFALLDVQPRTGRLHQIRRHLQGAGWPVLGDMEHGDRGGNRRLGELFGIGRLLLHACAIRLPHPAGGVLDVTDLPAPAEMRDALRQLGLADPLRLP